MGISENRKAVVSMHMTRGICLFTYGYNAIYNIYNVMITWSYIWWGPVGSMADQQSKNNQTLANIS